MPTNMYQNRRVFDDQFIPVLFSMEGLRSPRMITIDASTIQADSDAQKIIKPGSVLIRGNGAAAGQGRVFPGSRAIAATTTAQNTLTVRDASVFRPGDVIVRGAPGATQAVNTIAPGGINTTTNVLTLLANVANAVAIGDDLWVAIAAADILGIVVAPWDILRDSNDVSAFTSASVYGARMPFWNSLIQGALPEITTV